MIKSKKKNSNKMVNIMNVDKKRGNNYNEDILNKYLKVTKYPITNIYFGMKGYPYLTSNYTVKLNNFNFIFNGVRLGLNPLCLEGTISMITINNVSPLYTNYKKISEDRFNFISRNIKYNNELKYNKNGDIIFYLFNSSGYYKKFINMNSIENIIINIRKYVNNRIVFRLHPKDHRKVRGKKSKFVSKLEKFKKYNAVIHEDQLEGIENDKYASKSWKNFIDNIYCVFIQNSFMTIELLSYGIPVFSYEEYCSVNFYKDMYKPIEIISNLDLYDINRKSVLKKYYSHLSIHKNPNDISTIITKLYKKYYS